MDKLKHTPGPWKIEYNDPEEEYWVTRPHYDAGPAKIIYNIEDARLIAAAPDLLEALEGVMYWDNGKPEWETARAAIDKATGENK